jgi:hypothetical protein
MPASILSKPTVNGGPATVRHTRFKVVRRPQAEAGHPRGSVGADPAKRDYVRYLTERYNRCREVEASLDRSKTRFSYAFIFESIKSRFKAPTYFIPVERFEELVAFLQDRIDQTLLGKRKRHLGRSNYETFDEHQSFQPRSAG